MYELEEQRLRKLDDLVRIIQREYRAHRQRKYLAELREQAKGIYEGGKDRRRASIVFKFRGDSLQLAQALPVERILLKNGSRCRSPSMPIHSFLL